MSFESGYSAEESKKEKSSLPVISRRAFLVGTAALLATRAVEASESSETTVEETIEKSPYDEGISKLYERSLEDENEHAAYLYIMKDGTYEWHFLNEGNDTYISMETAEQIEKRFTDRIERIVLFHTHPVAAMYHDPAVAKEVRKNIRREKMDAPVMPPSFMDVIASAATKASMDEKYAVRLHEGIVDPGGIWEYKADQNNPRFKKIDTIRERLSSMKETLYEFDEIKKFMEAHNLLAVDSRLALKSIIDTKDIFSEKTRHLIDQLIEGGEALVKDPAIERINTIEGSRSTFSQNDPELKELQEAYREIGVTITFTPHKK